MRDSWLEGITVPPTPKILRKKQNFDITFGGGVSTILFILSMGVLVYISSLQSFQPMGHIKDLARCQGPDKIF